MRMSVVIPALNEAGNIGALVREVCREVPAENLAEVIVVDDGSTDATPVELAEIMADEPRLVVIRHAERSGQSAALRSGILAASSDIIATLDGDGQNDPADLPKLLALLSEPGSDGPRLVGGHRVSRKAQGSRRIASRAANRIRDFILADDCPDTGCGTKVFHRDAFMLLPFFTSMHRYLPALFQSYGFECAYQPVNDRPRAVGQSKYTNLGRALVGIYDLFGITWLRRRTKFPATERLTARETTAEHAPVAEPTMAPSSATGS